MKAKKLYQFSLICFLLCLVSCSRSCGPSRDKDAVITVDVATPIEALDPRYTTTATASRMASLIYGTLFELGDDLLPKPLLVESFEMTGDKTFKLLLKRNLKFHNGTPLTAHDVVYTYEQLKSTDVASPHAEKFEYVANLQALDDTTVVFELKQPHAAFFTDLCAIGIVSKKSCSGRSQQCRHELNGSGPFRLKSWDTAKEVIHLTPHALWFEGMPKTDLLFRVVRDENTRVMELMGKKADLTDGELSPTNAFDLKKQGHLTVKQIPGVGYTYLAINVRGPKADEPKDTAQYRTRLALADKRVRQAIAHAIDFQQIIDKLFLNTAERASGLLPKGHWAKDAGLMPPPFDQKLAEQKLDDAGFMRSGADSMRFKLTIATTPNRLRQSTSQLFADFLRKVGIDASIRVKDWSALYQDMKQGQFELFAAVWVPVTDPDLYHFVHHSSSIPDSDKAGGNRHGYQNTDVDRLIDEGRATMNQNKRIAIYQEIERKLIEDLPYIPLWHENRIVVINSEKIHNFEPSPTGSLNGLRKAYVAKDKAKH